MKKFITLLAIPAFLFFACDSKEDICPDFPLKASDISDQDAYLIVEAILKQEFDNSNVSHIAQESHFLPFPSDSLYFKSDDITFESDIIEDYMTMNSGPLNWGDAFDTEQDLIAEDEVICLIGNNFWKGFRDKYPDSDAILKIGKPIQNDNNEALVTFVYFCGPLCSAGYTTTLTKANGQWIVSKVINIWIS